MTATFVSQLRTQKEPIKLAEPGPGTLALRVECSDIWETVRVIAREDQTVSELKQRVVAQLFPPLTHRDDLFLKFRGWEMLDERETLKGAGLMDGSILLLAYRRRRAVR